MAQTVIGFFDNYTKAQSAVEQLTTAGISRDRIDISSGGSAEGTSHGSGSSSHDSESGISRFFRNLFGDDNDTANRYSRVGQSSQAIVTVHAQSEDEAERAADLLDDFGAVDVDERAGSYGSTSGNRLSDTDERSESIPVIREDLEVGKREVERGSVRVRSRIVERPVEEHVRLREEHVRVERNPVDRPVSGNELGAFREGEIELTERAEVPVVNKEARVVEEVRLSKEVTERDETIRDTVRSTDVDIENTGTSNRTGTDIGTADYRDSGSELDNTSGRSM
jgi:stress response protein YsnF